jgi:hypothetical protein
MMILHALVGYLAITALPSHPFAFASLLAAIDYDGYVNTTQNYIDSAVMKQALGTIVETCQTVTTHNQKDSSLMKRTPGDIIEARQADAIPPLIGGILTIVLAVTLSIIWIAEDDPVR